jgi:RTX calcium-binding nonapeptide repeat (4 copies)
MKRLILLFATMVATMVVASGVALAVTKIGTDGPDHLNGTNGDDILIGKGGNDILLALRGHDTLVGGPGKDVVMGGRLFVPLGGNKNLLGGSGNDAVLGGLGPDNLVGGRGNDWFVDGGLEDFATDILSAGPGNDVLDVATKTGDVVTCGSGFDRVLADRKDVVAPDCEKVVVVHGSVEDQMRQGDRFYESLPRSFFEGLNPVILG